jgi:alpha-1,6-mannosyltransferase
MKFIIFTAECFTMYGLFLVAKSKKIPVRIILLYALNPFIIAELTGNVHFEALLICFLVYTFYFLEKEKIIPVALFWALAINTKILPLILAPLFLRYLGFWRFVKMGLLSAVIVLILFIPFINSEVVVNISDSIEKFYNLFEFNASFYYLFSWISELFSNADYTQQIATALGIISTVGILIISFRHFKKGALFEKAMWIFTLYFLGAAMVQPWYISTMVMFCVFSRFRFPLVFSLLIELSYFPYMLKEYNENMYLILAEYLLLFLFIFYERRQIRKGKVVICLPEQNVTSHST